MTTSRETDRGIWNTKTWAEMGRAWRDHLRYFLNQVSSRAPVEAALTLAGEDPEFQRIAREWDSMDLEARKEAAHYLDELARKTAYQTRPYCQRCGTCCENSGPTLYLEDLPHIRSGLLSPGRLVTHLAGARVYSHFHGREITLEREVVMVAPDERGHCPYLARNPTMCRIHRTVPVQCLAQQCWDTSASERLQRRAGLTRLDIIPRDHPARGLVEEFEAGGELEELKERAEEEALEYADALEFLFGAKPGNSEQGTGNRE